jgi:Uma2 family endonuclease
MTVQVALKQPKVRIPKPRLFGYEDYVRLTPPDSSNYELHNGIILYMATPVPLHQIVLTNLLTEMTVYVKRHQLGRVLPAPMDTVFTPNDVLQPDLLYLSKERLHLVGAKKIEGAPDLVVEILSPSNHSKEMGYKKLIYELSGVREYWLVNLDKKTLTQYENVENEFYMRRVFQYADTLTSIILTGFEMPMSELFE